MYIQDSYSTQSTFTSTRLGLLRFIALQRLVTLVTLDTYNSTIFARAYTTISGKCRPLRSYINPNLLIKNVNLRFLKSKVTHCIVHKLGVCETLSNGCSHKLELVRCMISQVGRRRGSPVHGVGYQPVTTESSILTRCHRLKCFTRSQRSPKNDASVHYP